MGRAEGEERFQKFFPFRALPPHFPRERRGGRDFEA